MEREDDAEHYNLPHVEATLPVEQLEGEDDVDNEHYPHDSSEVDAGVWEEVGVVDSLYDVEQEQDEIDRREDRGTVEGFSGSRGVVVCEFEYKFVVDVVPFEQVDVQGEYPHVDHKEADASPDRKVAAEYWIGVKRRQVELLQSDDEPDD